jgi:hypothetical protein
MQELPAVRRVVTGTRPSGRSFIQQDGPSPAILKLQERPGYQNANLWRTRPGDAATTTTDDIGQHQGVLPPPGGTVLRVIDFPPSPTDPEELRRQHTAVFKAMFPDARHQPRNPRHPGMHVTATVDYAIVLQGEITAILEEDEAVLRAGDVLVQRGTNHAWANRTDCIARVAFVLVDASA